jgi:hypothetical protein
VALANNCDRCGVNWPHGTAFATCPRCRIRCRTAVTSHVLTAGEAKEQVNLVNWERFYSQHEQKRERLGRPSPEELGKREAFELIKAWHEVRLKLGEG